MLKNYLVIAFRNLLRQKGYTAIHILGLSIGITICLLIMLFVKDELSFDRYHEKAEQIYRVIMKGKLNGESFGFPLGAAPMAQTLRKDYPEVLEATRLRKNGSPFVTYGDKTFKEDAFVYADSNFFQVFTIPFLKGDPKTALIEPNSIVINKAIARKYFGNEDPIGKLLAFKAWNTTYKVTGLIDKVPGNSHFHFDLFASMNGLEEAKQPEYIGFNFPTYLVLPKGYDYKQLESKLPQVIERYVGPDLQKFMGMNLEDYKKKGDDIGLFLQPLTDVHLRSDYTFELETGGDIRYVYICIVIATFMLLIACINFMNLSTAGAARRAKEVGIRKVLGSVKEQLVGQFLTESILLAGFALLVSILLVNLSLPLFNALADKELTITMLIDPVILPGLLLFSILVGILAGSYPAFFLSSFQPVAVLKGKLSLGSRTIGLRSALVVFQFVISTILIIGTTVVYKQLTFIQDKKVGYDKEQVVVLHDTYVLKQREEVFRSQLVKDPRILHASISGYIPAGPTNNNNSVVQPEGNNQQNVLTQQYRVDYDYIPALNMQMVQGRNFSRDFPTDSSAIIINEAAMKAFNWTNEALNKEVINLMDMKGTKRNYRVIGVVKDFHFESLHRQIAPLVMFLGNNSGSIIVKAKTRDIHGVVKSLENQWSQFTADVPFSYSFLDERFAKTYEAEQKIGKILAVFAGITIFVACLGLFGLAAFTAQQRTKEIGIRKVLGASVLNIVVLLSKEFSKLVLIACLIAIPASWYMMNKWLEDFAYRIDIGVEVFIIAGIVALLIAWLTVSYQSIKSALSNPVKSLRNNE
jgi:putative ABC transport system permease protein